MRRLFPDVTAFADKVRAEFGNGVKLVYAEENGRKIGKQSKPGVAVSEYAGDAFCRGKEK